MKISSWVDFHLSNTQAWVRNSTPLIFINVEQVLRKFPNKTLVLLSKQEILLHVVIYMIKPHVRGFFDTDLHEVSWHFATHEAVRPNGF